MNSQTIKVFNTHENFRYTRRHHIYILQKFRTAEENSKSHIVESSRHHHQTTELANHWKKSPALSSASKSILSIPTHHRSTLPSWGVSPPRHGLHSALAGHRNPEICSRFTEKGFLEIPTLETLRTIHAVFLKNGLRPSIFHCNTLLSMYSKFGRFESALRVFDRMPERDAASWNAMVSGFVKMGCYPEAMRLFFRMREESVGLNGFVLASLVTGCDRSGWMVDEGVQLHGLVVKSGMGGDVYVGTTFVHFYGSYGFIEDTRRLFDEMPERNVVSWTALLVSFSKSDFPVEAVRAYQKMRREGVVCNQNSFATVVSSCGVLENEQLGLQVLAHIVVSGYELDVSVGNSLIVLFGILEKLEYAECIFHRMEHWDGISWNSMISVYSRGGLCEESLHCFSEMRNSGVGPDSSTLCSLMSACDCVDYLKWGKGLHAFAIKTGLDVSVSVCNTLVNMYTMCVRHQDAKLKFNEMYEKDLISWNSMISSYVQSGQYTDALKLFAKLLQANHGLSHATFASALAACANPEVLLNGKVVHAILIRTGLQENIMLVNALISMYCNCNAMNDAKQVFQMSPILDVISWNALIGGYVDNEKQHEAFKTFNWMRGSGIKANYITMVNIFGTCAPGDLLESGMPLHAYTISSGFEFDGFVKNSILTMYARCGDFDSCRFIFDNMVLKSAVSWNAMIAAKAHHGQGEEALRLLKEMSYNGLELDQFSLSGGLAACASLASLEEGQQLHSIIVKLGFSSDLHVTNAAMDMYGKCGKMDDVMNMLPERSTCSRQAWNILISGYARSGHFAKVKETFNEMLQMGVRPDYVTFVSLLSACNHAGVVHEGLTLFSFMTSEFGISPTIEHCVCIVDLLGRSGRLVEAEKFVEDMPILPNNVIWRSLLASSRIHGNITVGRKAAERLLELDPLDDSAFVLLSNVCAINSRWQDVEHVRTHMKSINLKKKPACSWIKVKNNVNTFGIGDRTHPQAMQIHEKLKEILQMVKQVGYVPDTTFVLHDTDEEQKEQSLWNHSEKLALAFGLISLPEGTSIRIFKNLRVCGDCHLVYKLVSRIVDRELVLRDPYRFHHFKGGSCSCSDYW